MSSKRFDVGCTEEGQSKSSFSVVLTHHEHVCDTFQTVIDYKAEEARMRRKAERQKEAKMKQEHDGDHCYSR